MKIKTCLLAGLPALALFLSACATTSQPGGMTRDNRVEVTRHGEVLHLAYEFDRDAAVWAFADSALKTDGRQPWRPEQWRVLTTGVVLDRVGHYDVLRTQDGSPVPRRVEIESRPRSVDLEAEYRTLVFSNGAVALPNRQVNLFPLASVAEAAALPADLNGVSLATAPIEAVWRDQAGPVTYRGERFARLITRMEKSYVLMGDVPVTRDEGLMAIIDPALPDWLSSSLTAAAPATGRWYRQRLGPAAAGADRPVLMAAWNGPTARMSSMSGSVLPGLIVMIFEGHGILTRDDEVAERALWFVAHEAAHFWLGQTVAYGFARDAWITEGGADLMAVRALKGQNPAYDDRAELQKEVDDCLRLARQPIATASERGEHRAYYACGAVFGLAAEAVQKRKTGGDFLDFVREILRRNQDGSVGAADWLEQFRQTGGTEAQVQAMTKLLEQGSNDPARELALILSDLNPRAEGGKLVLR